MSGPARASGSTCRRGARAAASLAILAIAISFASAQTGGNKGVPNALQGFSENRGQPIEIEASKLEVRDKQRVATFSGSVKVVQGDTTMRCKTMVVFYEPTEGAATAAKAATPGPGGSQKISRMEARGSVIVTQKDQTATGDTGLFDVKTNTVTLTGNVVVSQGTSVMRGERLVVNLTTGVSTVDAGKGAVRLLYQQQPQQQGAGGPPSSSPLQLPGRSLSPN